MIPHPFRFRFRFPSLLLATLRSLGFAGTVLVASCGGGDEGPAAAPPAVGASADDDVRVRALAVSVQTAALARWSDPVGLPIVPSGGAVMANGKVLFWSADGRNYFSGGGHTYSALFDPATNTSVERDVSSTGHDMFCSGTARLPDGRLLVNGGLNAGATSLYDPVADTWAKAAPMNIARGYNSSTTLADGSVMTLGGSWKGDFEGGKTAEIFTPAGGWRVLGGVPADPYLLWGPGVYQGWQSDSHMALIPTGNGRVLMAGPAIDMAWIDTRGSGSSASAGRRGDDVPSFSGNFAMIEAGKILKVGGAAWNNDEPASARAYLIDTTSGAADVRKLAPMAYPRVFANSVVLPNGQVVVIGGQTYAKEFSDSNAVLVPELYDPTSQTFTTLPAMRVPRTYHSVAALLPDGRVLSAGGGLCACEADHPDLQILSPPYLFNADGSPASRPVIASAPSQLTYGSTVAVTTGSAVKAFSLVRMGAVTHTVNNSQRRVSLGFTATDATHYRLSIPTNPGILLPGQWMLFATDAQGTPSLAKIVTVDSTGAPVLQNPGNVDLVMGRSTTLQTTATTPSGTLTYSARGLPAGLRIDARSGLVSGTPTVAGNFVASIQAANRTQAVSTDIVFSVARAGTGTGLVAEYFANPNLAGPAALRRNEVPNFDWVAGAPAAGIPADNFSARWNGWIETTGSGYTDVRVVADDGVRVWVGNTLVVDQWIYGVATFTAPVSSLGGGTRVPITIEYFEGGGNAALQLQWRPPGTSAFVPVPADRLYAGTPTPTTNLALGQPASQSSTALGGVASRAVDGNIDGNDAAGSVTQTGNVAARDWWQVDLGRIAHVDLVQLWNRTDCCTDRLANFVVFVSANDMTGRTFDQLVADPAVVSRAVGGTRAVPTIGIPLNAPGRYVRVQLARGGILALAEVQVFGGPVVFHAPTLNPVSDQQSPVGSAASLAVKALDPDGNALTYAATGLPPGITIDPVTGAIAGTASAAGSYNVGVSARNAGGLSASTAFVWTVLGAVPEVTSLAAPVAASGASVAYAPVLSPGVGAQYSWNFGDGTAETAFADSAAVSHAFAAPGVYSVTLTIRTDDGRTATNRFVQGISASGPTALARASSNLLLEPRAGAAARLWVVNADNDSVSVLDTATGARLAEVPVGAAPRSLALLPDGRVWVVNKLGASLSIVDPVRLAVVQTVALPRASQPFGLVVSPADGAAFVALEATGSVLKLRGDTAAAVGSVAVGDNPRHLAITANGSQLLVSRFISRPLPGEDTATVRTTDAANTKVGGEVVVVDPARLAVVRTTVLAHSDVADVENHGRGIPNYLGAAAISPDGRSAWVPSKQDNVLRGALRDGRPLDFQNTVRAVSSRIDLATGIEDAAARVDHDNSSVGSAAVYHPSGVYLFVALETSREVAVVDSAARRELFRFDAGLAPQGLVVSADGRKLYVSNLMSRSVSAIDLSPLVNEGQIGAAPTATWLAVGTERLTADVLRGKQLFYDATDPRLTRDSYMSCASCHNDGGHDGRTWDLSSLGEGLRNTIALRGRGGMGQGFLHWSANFDEVQDFESQIRQLAGGAGLMAETAFKAGTRSQPLGDAKARLAADLDALAAYVASLGNFEPSPWRAADGGLTPAAQAGRTVFANQNCASCHGGAGFTSSAGAGAMKNVGTLRPTSGQRLGAGLSGIDVPTLRDVFATAPYLHDGRAPTLGAAVSAHGGVAIGAVDLANLTEFLRQIGSEEPGPASTPTATPTATPTFCATEGGTCTVPPGSAATVTYGANGTFASRLNVAGPIGCNNANFGDPISGVVKSCSYLVTGPAATGAVACANEGGICAVPSGSVATVTYGANGVFASRQNVSGSIRCDNATFGDPIAGVPKLCSYQVTGTAAAAGAVACANEGGTCTVPPTSVATVSYGANGVFASRPNVAGSIGCDNATFGDPIPGVYKTCSYRVTGSR